MRATTLKILREPRAQEFTMTTTFECSGPEKDGLVTSLAALLLNDCSAEITADSIKAVVEVRSRIFIGLL